MQKSMKTKASLMTIEQMCQWMNYVAQGHTIPIKRCEMIAAALRAGQAMRDAPNTDVLTKAMRAWDKATEGEE